MIDFGWYLKLNHDLTRANTQGARVAAYSGTDTAVGQAVTEAATNWLNVTAENVSVTRENIDMERGSTVTVTTTANYSSLTHFSIVDLLLDQKEMQSTATIRIE